MGKTYPLINVACAWVLVYASHCISMCRVCVCGGGEGGATARVVREGSNGEHRLANLVREDD